MCLEERRLPPGTHDGRDCRRPVLNFTVCYYNQRPAGEEDRSLVLKLPVYFSCETNLTVDGVARRVKRLMIKLKLPYAAKGTPPISLASRVPSMG